MVAELTTRPAVAPAPDSHAVPGLIDALTPPDMARKAVEMGISKITLDVRTSFLLSILAGAFIAIGAIFSLTVTAGAASLPYGVTRLLAGLAFSLGLVLVVVGGASCSPATSCCSSPGAAGASPRSPSCATGRWSTSATSWARSARRRS